MRALKSKRFQQETLMVELSKKSSYSIIKCSYSSNKLLFTVQDQIKNFSEYAWFSPREI